MIHGTFLFFVFLFISLLNAQKTFAFPEMVRHGYINCTTCHVSPSGGGLLTEYGRELSREELSSTGTETESKPLYGLVNLPPWLNVGGDIRTLILYRNTPAFREGRTILMQADAEAQVAAEKLSVVATAGYKETKESIPNDNHFISRRHYVFYHVTDEFSLRGGKFNFNYGIMIPDHTTTIKRGLGWDQGSETYNLEGAYLTERLSIFITGIFGRPDDSTLNRESGVSISSAYAPGDALKFGVSYFYGKNTLGYRNVMGPYAIVAFSKQWVLLSELDFQFSTPSSIAINQQGLVNYQKLDFEFSKGWHVFATQELSRLNFAESTQDYQVYGAGIQVFPRPHLETSLSYQRLISSGVNQGTDLLFLQLHLYL